MISLLRNRTYLAWHFHVKPALHIAALPFGFLIPAALVVAGILTLAAVMALIDWLQV